MKTDKIVLIKEGVGFVKEIPIEPLSTPQSRLDLIRKHNVKDSEWDYYGIRNSDGRMSMTGGGIIGQGKNVLTTVVISSETFEKISEYEIK